MTEENEKRRRGKSEPDPRLIDLLDQLVKGQAAISARLDTLVERVGALRISVPPKTLTERDVSAAIAADPHQRFQVVEEYSHGGHTLISGRTLDAHHYARLVDHVRAGLKLALVD